MEVEPNNIYYGQDHCLLHRGIPSGVDFRVRRLHAASGVFKLTACGYGCREHPDCYGNGSLHAWGMTGRQRKRFEAACALGADA